jgi:putative sterol carrier protein
MATHEEITEALMDYQVQCNQNQRLKRMNRDWSRVILIQANDTESTHTMTVIAGTIEKIEPKEADAPDIIVIADSETLCDMFWGDLNPSQKYLSGELTVQGSQEDIIRLDAISMIIWG